MLKRPNGMSQFAWEAYQAASDAANINIAVRPDACVVQAFGDAKLSKGTHLHEPRSLQDMTAVRYKLGGKFYSAAADLSVKAGGLNHTQIATWIEELCRAGFVAFYRAPPKFGEHIHAVYAGVPMKPVLQKQCEDFFAGRDGLVSHSNIDDEYWYPSNELREIPHKIFLKSNGANPQAVRSPMVLGDVAKEMETYALYLNDDLLLHMPVIDSVALAPVRAWGTALGFKVNYVREKHSVQFEYSIGEIVDLPVSLRLIANVGHVPIRQLAEFSGLIVNTDISKRKVTISRAKP